MMKTQLDLAQISSNHSFVRVCIEIVVRFYWHCYAADILENVNKA